MISLRLSILLSLVFIAYFAQTGLNHDLAAQQEGRDWPFEAKVDQFLLHSDFELNDPQRLESILGGLRSDISQALNLPEQKSSIHVVLFSNAKEYSRYMNHYFPSIEPRRAIYLQDRGPGMLFTFWHDDIDTDLRHEAAHAVLNQSGVQLPLWLDEGVAEYFEVQRDKRFSQNGYGAEVAQRAAKGLVPSLLDLERIAEMSEFKDAHYRDSWAWIHFLLHRRQETRQLLIDYIARHRKLVPQANLSRQLAEIVADPTVEFQQHFSKVGSPQPTSVAAIKGTLSTAKSATTQTAVAPTSATQK